MGFPNDTTYLPNEKLKKSDHLVELYDTTAYRQNPSHDFYLRQIEFSNRQVKLNRSRMFPGLVAGYLNQGTKESPVKYRFQFGVTLPVFFWTYSSRISAAKKDVEISQRLTITGSTESMRRHWQSLISTIKASGILRPPGCFNLLL